jgi:Cu/Ag efflux protein CusF
MNTFFRPLTLSALVVAAAAVAGCQGRSGSSAPGEAKLYDVTGTVVSVDREKKAVTLDHEDIPGLMRAMKMEFSVDDPKALDGLSAGDRVSGKVRHESGRYVVTGLQKR